MSKPIPVYELEISLGSETFTVLTTSRPSVWRYDEYITDYSAKPVGYLVQDATPVDKETV